MKDFIQLLKLPPSILSAVSLASGLVLFLPEHILNKLGLINIPDTWRTILGISFIVSTSVVAIYIIIILFRSLSYKINLIRLNLRFPSIMKDLTVNERKIVTLLLRSENLTSRLPNNDGIVLRLASKMVIQLTATNSIAFGDDLRIPYTLTPIAERYLRKHPEVCKDFTIADLQELFNRYNNPYL